MAIRPLAALISLAPRATSLPRPTLPPPGEAWRGARGRVRHAVAHRPRGRAAVELGWRVLWLPFWIGSDIPAPRLPARSARPPGDVGLAGQHVIRMLDRVSLRLWLYWSLTALTRGAWLALLFGCFWLLLEGSGVPAFRFDALPPLAIGLVGLAAIFTLTLRPTRMRVARMLDRSFHLQERMTTAVGALGAGGHQSSQRPSIAYLQVADAANSVAELRTHPVLAVRLPMREVVLGVAAGLLLASLYFLRGVGGDLPPVMTASVPGFVSAADRIAREEAEILADQTASLDEIGPSIAEVEERARRSNEARQNLATLGDALDDHAVTRAAADRIAEGDYAGAADELRDLSASADQLSPGARSALADDLDAAAAQMSAGDEALADAARHAADGLRTGGEPAQQGLNQLGDQVETTGEDVISQQELAADRERAEAQAERERNVASAGEQGSRSDMGDNQQRPGESGDRDQAQDGSEQGQTRDSGDPGLGELGEAGEPGGMAAAPQDDDTAGPGQSGSPSDASGGEPGQSNPMMEGMDEFGSYDDLPEYTGQPGGQRPQGDPGNAGDPTQGGGASTSDGQPQPGDGSAPPIDDGSPIEDLPPGPRVSEADDSPGARPADDGPEAGGSVGLTGSGRQGVQTGSDLNTARAGAGAGSVTASGWVTQGEVGEAGPDSNRVPPEYRDIVEDFFSDPSRR